MARSKKKDVDLEAEALAANGDQPSELLTIEQLIEICPAPLLARFKKLKTPAARADFLYEVSHAELKTARDAYQKLDKFISKLENWFVQEFRDDQRGVTGKVGRVEVKSKDIASVEDWDAFYKHIKKKGEFELLNRAVNQKAVKERWEQGKQVPGVGTFVKKVISLTGVKK